MADEKTKPGTPGTMPQQPAGRDQLRKGQNANQTGNQTENQTDEQTDNEDASQQIAGSESTPSNRYDAQNKPKKDDGSCPSDGKAMPGKSGQSQTSSQGSSKGRSGISDE